MPALLCRPCGTGNLFPQMQGINPLPIVGPSLRDFGISAPRLGAAKQVCAYGAGGACRSQVHAVWPMMRFAPNNAESPAGEDALHFPFRFGNPWI
jgi:hypothetical protein